MDIENKNRVSVEDMRACYAERFPYAPNNRTICKTNRFPSYQTDG